MFMFPLQNLARKESIYCHEQQHKKIMLTSFLIGKDINDNTMNILCGEMQ